MIRTLPNRLLGAVTALVLFSYGSIAPAQDGGPTILITPVNGVANSFELVRVHPDKVEVRREGIRLNFSRDAIKSVKNADASRVLEEAEAILEEAGQEDVEKLPDLLARAERTVPRVEGVVQKFDWLIPEATETLTDIRQALFALRDSSRAVERLEMLDTRLEEMVEGTSTLSATWEQIVDEGLEVSKAILFPGIQEDFEDRFTRMRREIRLDLSRRRLQALERIRKIGETLLEQVDSRTLNESRLKLDMSELDRLYERIFDPKAKEEIAKFVEEVKESTSREIQRQELEEAFARASKMIESLREGLDSGTIAPVSGERVHPLERAKELLAALPDSPTKEILSVGLSDLDAQVAQAIAASAQRQPMAVDIPPPDPNQPPPAPDATAKRDNSLFQTLTWSLGWGAGLGVAVVAGLVGGMVFAGRMMKKKKQAKASPEEPKFANQYDIFESESKEGSEISSPASAVIDLPPEPAPPPVVDPFGFAGDDSKAETVAPKPAIEAESVPEDPFDIPPEGESLEASALGGEDNPFELSTELEEEDVFGLGETVAAADDPFGLNAEPEFAVETPESLDGALLEEDVFGSGALDETLDEMSREPPLPPASPPPAPPHEENVISVDPDPTPMAEDDPLGLGSTLAPASGGAPKPESPPKQTSSPAPSNSLDDDPFGFKDMLSEDEE